MPEPYDSRGVIDRLLVEDDTLKIEGWTASRGAGKQIGFEVSLAGQACSIAKQELCIASPDVLAAFPDLDSSDYCRFMLQVNLPGGLSLSMRDLRVAVEPRFEHGAGKCIYKHMVAPTLPDPPEKFITFIGSGFRDVASEFLDYFVNKGGLKPADNVLDVGCGIGRMAYGLVDYLLPSSKYEGFDIVPELIEWTTAEITSRYQNFCFSHAPIYNSWYNPKGHLTPSQFIFPYPDQDFAFIFLTSVFTHMPGGDIRHYMDEIRRNLRLGGRAVITCFLLNDENRPLIKDGKSKLNLVFPSGDGMIADPDNPDYAIGFDEARFIGWLTERGMSVTETLYGSWCGRSNFVSYQDILVVQG